MRIDPEDFEKDGEGQTGFEVNGGSKSQPQTVNDKLRQAKNFLSDKDANRRLEFPSRYEKIDKFLQLIAKERIECDGKLYDEVQAMVQVHRSRVNRAKVQNTRRPDSSLPPLQSDRLSLIDTSVREHFPGAPLRDDHPPFTLERPVDQNLFIKALHSPASGDSGAEARRAELLKIESDGFLETLKNPSLVHEWIEESESQTRDERFNARATRRGRRRAAIRMALRSFATNCEQHHKGRWDRCDFRLPSSPVVKSPGGSLVFAKTKNSQKDSERSLSWTEKYQNYLQAQRDRPQDRNDRSSEELAQPHHGNQPISIKRRAMDILRAEIRKENQENKQRFQSISDMDWDPPENTGAGKPYVSLDRWPGTASKSTTETSEQSSKSRLGSGTSLGSREVGEKSLVREISQVQSNSQTHKRPRRNQGLPVTVRKPPEKFFRGEPAFTFAETPFLQAVTSKWIEHDIGSGTELIPQQSLTKTELSNSRQASKYQTSERHPASEYQILPSGTRIHLQNRFVH